MSKEMLVAICTTEPRGDKGLEGYQRGDRYMAEKREGPDHRSYFRLWPTPGADYETCSSRTFHQYFMVAL